MAHNTRSKVDEGASPLVGVRRATYSPESSPYRSRRSRDDDVVLPADSECWEVTADYRDFALRNHEFLPADTAEGCREVLDARFPGPASCPALRRVEARAARTKYVGGGYMNGTYINPTHVTIPEHYFVHARPYLITAASDAELAGWAALHGPILLNADRADSFSTDGTDCVLSDAGTLHYRLLRYDPIKSGAVAKGAETKERNRRAADDRDRERREHANELDEAGTRICTALSDLAGAMQDDLARFDISDALACGTCACLPMTIIHAKFRGRYAYRRLSAWAEVGAAYRARPVDLDLAAHLYDEETIAFVVAESKARKPRPKPDKSATVDVDATAVADNDDAAADESDAA